MSSWRRSSTDLKGPAISEERLVARSVQFDIALSHMPHGLCMFDAEKHLILCNPAYHKLYCLPAELTCAGVPLARILDYRQSIGNAPLDFAHYFDVVHVALEKGEFASTRVVLKDGRTIQITHNPMPGGGYVATHEDVTDYVSAEAQRNFLASHDPLTKLLNRGAFISNLERRLADLDRPALSLQLLDLDDFKPVNDTFGHQTGDYVLETIATRLTELSSDVPVCRLGGDEFAILQPYDLPAIIDTLSKDVIDTLTRPIDIGSHQLSIGVSIGVAILDGHVSSREFFHNADIALYMSKTAGGNRSTLFRPGMTMPSRAGDHGVVVLSAP